MVILDYRTNNPRWGLRGIIFQSWENYAYTLGYLSNIDHFHNHYPRQQNADISVHIECNNEQGAWNKEGRIHFYGEINDLEQKLPDLFLCSSAGTRNITRRINSNGYIVALINDFHFEVRNRPDYSTAAVFPTERNIIEHELQRHLEIQHLSRQKTENCMRYFQIGFSR